MRATGVSRRPNRPTTSASAGGKRSGDGGLGSPGRPAARRKNQKSKALPSLDSPLFLGRCALAAASNAAPSAVRHRSHQKLGPASHHSAIIDRRHQHGHDDTRGARETCLAMRHRPSAMCTRVVPRSMRQHFTLNQRTHAASRRCIIFSTECHHNRRWHMRSQSLLP